MNEYDAKSTYFLVYVTFLFLSNQKKIQSFFVTKKL